MERHENESFEDYKQRRAAASNAVKLINFTSKHQRGLVGSREKRRQAAKDAAAVRGTRWVGDYGRGLAAQISRNQLQRSIARKTIRANAEAVKLAA